MKPGDLVVKNPVTWVPTDFDHWARGEGVGIVVVPPFALDDDMVDVQWPTGRCFENVKELLPMKINYIEGDLFEPLLAHQTAEEVVLVPHVVNSVGAWGAGFVAPLGHNFLQSRQNYLQWYKNRDDDGTPFEMGCTQFVYVRDNITICNMLAQEGLGTSLRRLKYNALVGCMMAIEREARRIKTEAKRPVIWAPMFGSGLAGGIWPFIEFLIEDCWLKEGIPVTVYYLQDHLPGEWSPPQE